MTPLSASEFAREARRAAQAHTGESIEPEQPSHPAPTPAPQRKAATIPVREEKETPKRYTPPSSAFPHAMPTVSLMLPEDGTGKAITDYFNRKYGVKPTNRTAERGQRLAAKLAANPRQEEYTPVGDWRGDWDSNYKIGEETETE